MSEDTVPEDPSFTNQDGGYYYLTVFFKKEATIVDCLKLKEEILAIKVKAPIEKIHIDFKLPLAEQLRAIELLVQQRLRETDRLLPFFRKRRPDDE